jgi:hypothetical protein
MLCLLFLYDLYIYCFGGTDFILPVSMRLFTILVCVCYMRRSDNHNVWNADECAVCLEQLKPRCVTLRRCKHQFHRDCVIQLTKCPLCRKPFTE